MMIMERGRSGTWRARRSPRTGMSGSMRQSMTLEDVQMKTVALKYIESKWLCSVESKRIISVLRKCVWPAEAGSALSRGRKS
ncbi:uncharacterized protein PITG_17320 [Phytophthora infestans T30-4]|uniref:Uncharacterized protein n=1 Tax=Phytophthora infestans (strain T30-4) TaxID=403677 RepID=D0NVS9_PHYIT|nr:uncharacterized protein PITG_17320 [Phytophthora infestans T30-4]EEY66760.1 hypothetical protein PITG_17320 [Phytophthora infestans T30-4]|eukprot:XP_002896825.1 hypothetical protein PITG_17320 [Phytophthora infestans T30-4]